MAKERLTLYDKYGNVVEYDVSTEDVTLDNEGGKSLKTKLTELDDADDAAVKKVTFNGNPYNANGGEINIGNQMQPDWNETSPTYPTFIKNKPSVVTGIKVGASGSTITPTNGVVTLPEPSAQVTVDTDMSDTSENAVQNKIIKAYVDAVSQRIDTLIGSGNVQGAIDTFNEVVAFLNGINSSDTLAAKLALKANSSDLANYATKSELTSGLSSKQNTLTFDNTPTAGNTDHVVSSAGIRTALDTLLQNLRIVNNEWYIGNTPTGVSAQGPTGNVEFEDLEDLVALLVNDLTTGGAGNFLSAEMGKVLKTAISTLINSMGEYCFPNGRPTLSWEGPKCNVTQTLTNVSSNFSPLRIDKNGALEITLTPVDNLHVFLTGDVKVEMPLGTDITSTAWNENTGKVTIADVTDDVVITAQSSTYVGYGETNSPLVSMFDGKNRGGVSGEWADVIDPTRKIVLTNCTEYTDHVYLDGERSIAAATSANTGIDVGITVGTIETVSNQQAPADGAATYIFVNNFNPNKRLIMAGIRNNTFQTIAFFTQIFDFSETDEGSTTIPAAWIIDGSYTNAFLSMSDTRAYLNGVGLQRSGGRSGLTAQSNSRLGTFNFVNGSGLQNYRQGSLYCARVYSRPLTENEVLKNYAVDQKRFNLA